MPCDELKRLEDCGRDVSITSVLDHQGLLWRIEARRAGRTELLGEAREFDAAIANAVAHAELAGWIPAIDNDPW